MTVNTTTNKITLSGDGTLLVFPFTFTLQQASDLQVYVNGVLISPGLYTVQITPSNSGNATGGVGGNVVFNPGQAPVAGTGNVLIARILPITQPLSPPVEGNIPETSFENAYDRGIMISQQLQEAVNRALALPITAQGAVSLVLPNPIASNFLQWDPTGTFLQNTSISLSGGGALGPATTTPRSLAMWNNTTGSLLKDGPALGILGQALLSNGPSADPSFQTLNIPAAQSPQSLNGYRLSANATDPEPSGDITGATSVYMIPYIHDQIAGYDGAKWNIDQPGIQFIAIPASQFFRKYNVYWDHTNQGMYLDPWDSAGQVSKTGITAITPANSAPAVVTFSSAHPFSVGDLIGFTKGTGVGTIFTDTAQGLDQKIFYVSAITSTTVTLEGSLISTSLVFTSGGTAAAYKIPTAPATAPVRQNGVWARTGDLTKRWLGVFRTNGLGTLDDAAYARRLSNVSNPRPVEAYAEDVTANYVTGGGGFFYPRTNSIQIGVTRIEIETALSQDVFIGATDGVSNNSSVSGFAVGIGRVFPGTLSTWQNVLEFGMSANVGVAYNTGMAASKKKTLPAGSTFIQMMNWGGGNFAYGRNQTSSVFTNESLSVAMQR